MAGSTVDQSNEPITEPTTESVGAPPSHIPENEPSSTANTQRDPPPSSLRSSVSWKTLRSTFTISEKKTAHLGWLIALFSVLLTVVALSPAFKSQDLSTKALRLAEWTAMKDYIEECREELAAGMDNQSCQSAMSAELPPPPYVTSGMSDKLRRSLVQMRREDNGTRRAARDMHRQVLDQEVTRWGSFLILALLVCAFFVVSETLHRLSRRSRNRAQYHLRYTEQKDELTLTIFPPTHEVSTATTTIRHPPTTQATSLRRRAIRSHPIYEHANLEEALHHCALPEIRLRLSNGEDVNKHWPYLIYALAVTPSRTDMRRAQRLEVARLCLDFGADVNALKGWNGQSALLIAIHFGNVDVAKLLIANGATVGYAPPDSDLTPLNRCVRLAATGVANDAIEIMEMLFEYGADANQEDRIGETALHKLLIEAWLKREIKNVGFLVPVAMCLLEHGARVPRNIKEKYLVGNPLWDVVKSAAKSVEGLDGVDVAVDGRLRGRLWQYQGTAHEKLRASEGHRSVRGAV
jgi:hypothetical protein